jgi:hypothetical protein
MFSYYHKTGPGAFDEHLVKFQIGDRVEKHTGGYRTFGTVAGYAVTSKKDLRYVVEIEPQGGMLMIYNEGQLQAAPHVPAG